MQGTKGINTCLQRFQMNCCPTGVPCWLYSSYFGAVCNNRYREGLDLQKKLGFSFVFCFVFLLIQQTEIKTWYNQLNETNDFCIEELYIQWFKQELAGVTCDSREPEEQKYTLSNGISVCVVNEDSLSRTVFVFVPPKWHIWCYRGKCGPQKWKLIV